MGEKDSLTKKFMSRPDVFADAFNYLIYEGYPVIKPDQLRDLDTSSLALPYINEKGATVQRVRDVLKYLVAKTDDKAAYVVLGIENQTDIHYAMPVRNMLYDALQYENQVKRRESSLRRSGEKMTGAEYLSGFRREDKLKPVITLVIYWGEDKWDAPTELFDMLDETDSALLPYVSNYKINLITPDTISDEKLARIPSEFRQAMKFIQVSGDDRLFDEEIMGNPDYRHLEHDTAVMLRVLTHLDIEIEEGEKEVNMCTAVEKLIEKRGESYLRQGLSIGRKEGREEGRKEGLSIGREEGLSIGREEGLSIGREEAIANTVRLLREMQITDDEISRRMQKQFSLTSEQMAQYLAVQ